MATPYATRHLVAVSSTQDEARRRYRGEPLLLTADRQTGGRGRSGRAWLEAPRAVYASLALRPPWPVEQWPWLSLVAGLAARTVLRPRPGLKWPNDLLDAAGAKVGGLLLEAGTAPPEVVIGMGVNLWWPDPPDYAAGLLEEDPGPDAARDLARAWAGDLLARVMGGGERNTEDRPVEDWGVDEYRKACVTIGRSVVWEGGGPAMVLDVDREGGLVVESPAGIVTLTSGEVRHVREATLHDRSQIEADP